MRDNKDSSGPLPKQAAVPTTKSQVPAVRSGVPITLDKHAAVTEATAELATLLGHFGGKKWSAWNEKYHTARPTREHIAAVRALLPSVPRVQEQWAEAYQPTSADFLVAEMGMVAEGMPLANNINPKVFLQNLVDNLRRQDPPPTMWEVREARIAFVGKAHFADVAGFLEIFAEKREEAKYISKILKPALSSIG